MFWRKIENENISLSVPGLALCKLSMTTGVMPAVSISTHVCDPMYPAPPVTSTDLSVVDIVYAGSKLFFLLFLFEKNW